MSDRNPSSIGIIAVLAALLGLISCVIAIERCAEQDPATASADSTSTQLVDARTTPPLEPGDSALDLRNANKAVISGTIRDAQGSAIAGATVCAWANQSRLRGIDDGRPRCTTSEHDGHFRLEGLWAVPTSISANAPEFQPGEWSERVEGRRRLELPLHPGQETRDIVITLAAGGVPVRGVVKDISGGVIDGALVSASKGQWFGMSRRAVTVTDDEGRFELWAEPGESSLYAQADGYASARTDCAAPTELAEIFMTPESTISGTIVHAQTGAPVSGAEVTARGQRFFGRGFGAAVSNDAGQFRITGLEPGVYDLTGTTDDLYGEAIEQVHLGLAEDAEDTLVTMHPAFSITGTVVIAETGEPCTEGSVRVESTPASDGTRRWSAIDERGGVLLRGLLPGGYTVEVTCDGYLAQPHYKPLVLTDQSLVDVEWRVRGGLAIRGVVVDSSGHELEQIHVRATAKPKPGEAPRPRQTSNLGDETEADGNFELRGLLPGSYELSAGGSDYPSLEEPELVELGESADLEGVRLVLPATGRLIGIVRDEHGGGVAGVSVSVSQIDRRANESTRTGDDGRFVFAHLPTGSSRVRAHVGWSTDLRAPGTTDDDVQGEVVEIDQDREAEVELVVAGRNGTISGRVVDSDGGPVTDAFIDATRMSDSAAAGSSGGRGSLRWGWDRQPVLTDFDGAFTLRELSEGSYMIRAYRKGGGEAIVEQVALGSTGVVLTIVQTGQIAGKVVFADGGSPDRFTVQLTDKAAALSLSDGFFRTEGAFAMRELPPGTYQVSVSTTGGSAQTTVELAAGASIDDLTIELQGKITVEGRLIDADTGVPVPGYRVSIGDRSGAMMFGLGDSGDQRNVSDAEGHFEVEDAPTGPVRLTIVPRDFANQGDYGWSSRNLKLAAAPELQNIGDIDLLASRLGPRETHGDIGFKPKRTGPEVEAEDAYFEVAVIRPGGPADASGLALGDRITKVDGREVTGLDSHRYNGLTRAPPGTELELTIEGKQAVTIVIGPPLDW